MKRTKNRILSVFLSFCMIVSCMVGISITAGAAGSVSFLDADGTDESCTEYTSVTESTTAWSTGWYVVDSTTQISQRVTVTGDVHLILCDGKTLTAENGIAVEGENSLTIYAQSTAETTMGMLTATGGENGAGIGDGYGGAGGTITINGGVVEANGGLFGAGIGGGRFGAGGTITINGGKVEATGGEGGAGIGGGYYGVGVNITITGGNVTANGDDYGAGIGGGFYGAGGTIKILGGQVTAIAGTGASAVGAGKNASEATITLGWTNADDFIDAQGTYKGTVSFAEGKSFLLDGTTIAAYWNSMSDNNINNKKLVPHITYLDETGAEQTCTDYITVTEATGSFENGNWYVVNSDVTLTSDGLYVFGDVNLILCDGAKLTVNGGIGCYEDGGFTVYAQSTGENMGKLIATYNEYDGYGIGNKVGNRIITINGGDIQATGKNFPSASLSPAGIFNYDNPVIINGGKVTASGNLQGIAAKSVTINGGEVVASSTRSSAIYGTLTVADGLTVFGGDSADPTTVRTDYATTRWKYMTVKAIPPEPVSYLDETGETQTCTDYIVVAEAIGELTDGNWYVFNSDVTITGGLYVNGDVNLILCDGAKLTVNGGIECYEDGGFTIYAQSTGENMGKLIATYGEKEYGIGNQDRLNRIITINGGDIQATGSPTETLESDAGIYNYGNPVIINGGKVTASGYNQGIDAKSVTINGGKVTVSSNRNGIHASKGVTINGGEVIASGTEYKAILGTLTVADGLTVFGGDSADPTTVRTDYAEDRWKYMTVKAAELYSVTLTGGANATPDPAEGVSQTDIYGDMATVVYTANPGYYFEEFADITVNGITATRTDAQTVTVSGTPTDDAVLAVPDATATLSSTVNVVWNDGDNFDKKRPDELTATLAGVDSYTLNAENSWIQTVTGLTDENNNWSIASPEGYSSISSTEGTVTTYTFIHVPKPYPVSMTADSITLAVFTGFEYSKDNGETWQDSPTFTGLAPGTKYTFVQRPKGTTFTSPPHTFGIVALYVKFIVVNGKWDDGTDAEKTVVLARGTDEDLLLRLKSSDIPAVGSKPDNGYKAGSWDTVPTTEAAVSADKTFTYTYAEKTTPTITAVPTASAVTYGQKLSDSTLTGGSATSGNEAVPGTFTWTTPTTKPAVSDSGTTLYEVKFTPTDTANYKTVTCNVTLTVNKATPTITTAPTASAITYGQKLSDSTLSGGAASVSGTFTWTTPATAPAVADSNTTEYDVTFTPNDTDNYTTAACKVKLTVGKAEPTITTAPTASAITYGQTLADSTLSGGAASVQGTFTWTTPTTAPAVADSDTTEYDVTFTPADTANYNTASCKVKLTVNKAEQTAPAGIMAFNETYDGSADGRITGVDSTMEYRMDGEATYTAITGTEITGLAAGTYKVRYKETETQTASPDTDAVVNSGSKITVTFDTNGGSRIPETQEHTYREKAVKPADKPIKTGHTFRFWSLDGTAEYDFETELTANITLKAVYSVNRYTITFDTDGGSVISPITQDYGTEVTAPSEPYKTGYSFVCWDKEIPATMPAEDLELAAKWVVNQYTISFDTDGGSVISPITQDYGTEVKIPETPTKAGYDFVCWDKIIPATMPAENMTFKAIWSAGTKDSRIEIARPDYIPLREGSSVSPAASKPANTESGSGGSQTVEKHHITGIMNKDTYASELSWDTVGGASGYSLYVEVDDKFVFIQDLGDSTSVDVILSTNGKYYVHTGDSYTVYTYDSKTKKFRETGTIKANKIDTIKVKNNVKNHFMVKFTVGGKESSEKDSYKVSVKIYYKPAVKITANKGSISLKWNKVPGAEKYRVYKYVNGKLKLVTETTKRSVKINGTKSGKTYTYAVKALIDGEWTKVYGSDLASIISK